MVDQDFFLRFGSNAEDFARDVKQEISGARRELGLLSKEIQNVNRASQGSATAKLVSGIRSDIRSMMGDVASTIGQELRSALRGELKNLNLGDIAVNVQPQRGGGGGGRARSTDVTDTDLGIAELQRAQKQISRKTVKVSEDLQGALQQAVGTLSQEVFQRIAAESKDLGKIERAAFLALSGVLERMQARAKSIAADISAQESIQEDRGRGTGRRGGGADEVADTSGADLQVEALARDLDKVQSEIQRLRGSAEDLLSRKTSASSIFNKTIHALKELDARAAERLEAAVFQTGDTGGPRRVTQAPPSQPTGEITDRLIAAGNIMTAAANEIKSAVGNFKLHVDAFQAAAQNVRVQVEGVVATGRPAPGGQTPPQDVQQSAEQVFNTIQARIRELEAVLGRRPGSNEPITQGERRSAESELADLQGQLQRQIGDALQGESNATNRVRQAKERVADSGKENAQTVEDIESTDRQSAELAKQARKAREEIVQGLRNQAARANDPSALGFDSEELRKARSQLRSGRDEPIRLPGPPPLVGDTVEAGRGEIFAGGSDQDVRQVARALELIAQRQSATGSRGATERLGLSDADERELSILEQGLSEAGRELLRKEQTDARSAAELRAAAERLRAVIEAAGPQEVVARQRSGAITPPPGTVGFGSAGRLDRREGDPRNLNAVDEAAYQQVRAFGEAQTDVAREVVRDGLKAALSLEEFDKVLEGLPTTVRKVAQEFLTAFDLDAADPGRQRVAADFRDDDAVERARIQTAAVEREAERDRRAQQQRRLDAAREQVRTFVTGFQEQQGGRRPSANLFQGAQRRGRDIDAQIGQTQARIQALEEGLLRAQSDDTPDEGVQALKDELRALREYLQSQRAQAAADVDVSGRTFVGERFKGGRVRPGRRDEVIEQAGPGLQRAVGGLIEIYERESERLNQALVQQGRRRAALADLQEQEALSTQFTLEGEPLRDESIVAKAEQTLSRIPEEIDQTVRNLERFLTTPGVAESELSQLGPEIEQIFRGRSFEEVIQGRAARTTPATTIEEERTRARTTAELEARRRIAEGAGVESVRDLPEGERREANRQVTAAGKKAVAEFDKQVRAAAEVTRRQEELADVYKGITDTLNRQRGPLDIDALRGRLQQEGLLGQQDLDVDALRAVASGSTQDDLLRRAVEPFGGVQGAVEESLRAQGITPGGSISLEDPIQDIRAGGEIVITSFSELQAATRSLTEQLQSIPGGDVEGLAGPPTREQRERIGDLSRERRGAQELISRRERTLESQAQRSAQFNAELASIMDGGLDRQVQAIQELARRLVGGGRSPDDRAARAASLRNVAIDFGIDPKVANQAQGSADKFLSLASNLERATAAEQSSEQATERLTAATEEMVTLYRGTPDNLVERPDDPTASARDTVRSPTGGRFYSEDPGTAAKYIQDFMALGQGGLKQDVRDVTTTGTVEAIEIPRSVAEKLRLSIENVEEPAVRPAFEQNPSPETEEFFLPEDMFPEEELKRRAREVASGTGKEVMDQLEAQLGERAANVVDNLTEEEALRRNQSRVELEPRTRGLLPEDLPPDFSAGWDAEFETLFDIPAVGELIGQVQTFKGLDTTLQTLESAGIADEQTESGQTLRQLVEARTQALTQAAEEFSARSKNTDALKASTEALKARESQPRPEEVVSAENRFKRLPPEVAADLLQNLTGPIQQTSRLSEEGFSFGSLGAGTTFDDLLNRAREVRDGGEDSQSSQIRNLLAKIAGLEGQFGSPGDEITTELITAASAARTAMVNIARETGATGTLEDRAAGDASSRLIRVLDALQASIDRLAGCCDAMQSVVRSGGTGAGVNLSRADEVARARGTQGAERIISTDTQNAINIALREAAAAATPEARRRALGQAALAAKGDPSLGLNDATIVGIIQRLFKEGIPAVQSAEGVELAPGQEGARAGQALTNDDVAAIKSGLLQLETILEAGGRAAAEAFKNDDITAAAEAVQNETRNVEQTLSTLRAAFDVTEEDILALSPRLEQFEQGLQELDARLEASDDPQRQRQESINESLREASAADFAGSPVNLGDQSPEAALNTAEQALRNLGGEAARYETFLQEMLRIYPNLSKETRDRIQDMVKEQRQYVEQSRSAQAFAQALATLLPDDLGGRFVGAVGTGNQQVGGEVLKFLENSGRNVPTGVSAAITQALTPDGGEIRTAALNTVNTWAQAAQAQMSGYRTPFQNLIRALFRGQNIVQATLSQAGFAISRFLGGSVIFSAINQLQLLGEIALETEQTFIRVQAALEATGRSADGLRTKLQDIAVDTNVSLNDTVEVMAQLVGVFETTEEALAATTVVNQLELISQGALNAREGFRSLSAVASTFQDELSSRGLTDVEAIEYIADLTVRLQDLTGVNIEDTIEGLGRLGETATALNIPLELLATSIGLTAKATGQTGQAASEQIGRILANFQSVDAQNLLVDLGVTDQETVRAGRFGDVLKDLFENYETLTDSQRRAVANTLGDPRQFAATNALLIRGSEALDTYEKSFNNAGSAADRTEQILNTFRGQVGQLGKQIQTFVQILVDLGILTLFGAALKVLSEVLGVVNDVFQIFSNIADVSPLGSIILQATIAIGTFLALKTMLAGVVDQFLELNQVQVQAANGSALQNLIFAFGQRGGGGPQAPVPFVPAIGPISPGGASSRLGRGGRQPLTQRSPLLRGAIGLSGLQDDSRLLGKAADKARQSVQGLKDQFRQLRPKLTGLGAKLKAMGPAILGGAFAIALLIDAITKADREAREFYQGIGPGSQVRRESIDETEAEAAARARREEMDAMVDSRRELEKSALTWDGFKDRINNAGAVLNYFGSNLGDLVDIFLGTPRQRKEASDAAFDAVIGRSQESEFIQDQTAATLRGINARRREGTLSDADTLSALQAVRESNREEYGRLIEEAPSGAVAKRLTEDFEAIDESLGNAIEEIASDIAGVIGDLQLDTRQLERFLSVFDGLSGFNIAELGRYSNAIQEAFLNFLPVGSEGEIQDLLGATDYQSRLRAQAQTLDFALAQARDNLIRAEADGDPEKIEEARDQLRDVLQQRVELDREILSAAVDLPVQFSEFAIRAGDFERAERYLSSALQAVRQQRAEADPGSPEEAQAIQREFDILRQTAEAQIGERVAALELASIGLDDPIASAGNELEALQLKLQSAEDNPGAYSAEEIRGFISEIAQLQEQIADEQEDIADAYGEYLAANANNEITRTAIEYESALRKYRRAIENDAGAAAITRAATEVNEAARAQREAAEALRAARAETQIARIPEGDSYRRSLAQLREAFEQQASVIEEFGRDSVEFEETVTSIIDIQREAQEAAREIADSTLAFASSLAGAAGLDIRVARLTLEQARADVERAIQDSGGRTDTAAVRQALSAYVDAQAGVRDVILGEATETIDFMLNMEEITEQQAIQVLQQILDTADLTEDQRRDLLSRIKSLKDSINQGVSDQFNLGDIRIPTPFEVRRALKVEEITQGVQDAADVIGDIPELDEPTLPGDRIPEAPEGLLEQILGPELASEIGGLGASGGNITQAINELGSGLTADLLPPLSQIPQIIDTQLATRERAIQDAQRQIETMVTSGQILNNSVQQLGPVIAAPMELIRESQEYANSLITDTNEAMDQANSALESLKDLVSGIRGDMLVYFQGVNENGLTQGQQADADRLQARADQFQRMQEAQAQAADAARLQAQADAGYRPPAREDARTEQVVVNQEVTQNYYGMTVEQLRTEQQKTLGTVAIERQQSRYRRI